MTIQTQDLPKSILQPILELFDRGDFEAALIGVEKALLKFPHSIVLLNIQGMTLGKLNQHEAAVQVFQQIVKTNPEYAEVFINMGNAFYDKEDLDSCLDCYAKALNIKPDQSEWALYVIEALTGHTPKKKILHPIILGNDAIKKTFRKFKQSKPIADRDVIEVFFKCENLQTTGSFKLRGATNKILTKEPKNIQNGVVAYSSGNHAQAVAYAALQNDLTAKIIMPKNAPKIKIENTKAYGAEVILYDTFFENRELIGNQIKEKENRELIKPYDDLDIIAGQGTAAVEMVSDLEKLSVIPDIYLCCCGGGGLIAGTSTYLKQYYPNIDSYSVEPEGFDDTKKSLENRVITANSTDAKSICDALLAPMPGEITFAINKENLKGGFSVSDEEVKKTIILLSEHLKIVVEPGGAVATAALLNKKINVENKKVLVMISGGNMDLELFKSL
mgnify:CR=1 FL=1